MQGKGVWNPRSGLLCADTFLAFVTCLLRSPPPGGSGWNGDAFSRGKEGSLDHPLTATRSEMLRLDGAALPPGPPGLASERLTSDSARAPHSSESPCAHCSSQATCRHLLPHSTPRQSYPYGHPSTPPTAVTWTSFPFLGLQNHQKAPQALLTGPHPTPSVSWK